MATEISGHFQHGHNKRIKSLASLCGLPPCQQPKFNITKRKMRAYVRALVEKLSLAH